MKIIKPIQITPGMVTSNVVEVYPTWNASATYSKGYLVVYQYNVYESLIDTNLNKPPSTSPLAWLLVGPSNRTAAFDTSYSTQTVGNTNILFEISGTEIINSLAVLNIYAPSGTLTVQLFDGDDNLVYSKVSDLDDTLVSDWYEYFFNPFEPLEDVVYTDLPPYSEYTLMIAIGGSGELRVGTIILGNYQLLGFTQYGLSFGIKDYSLKEENDYGDIVFTERNYAKTMEPSIEVRNTDLRRVTRFLTSIRATPTVFIPTDIEEYSSLITYGFVADWNTDIVYPEHSLLRLEVKGLT